MKEVKLLAKNGQLYAADLGYSLEPPSQNTSFRHTDSENTESGHTFADSKADKNGSDFFGITLTEEQTAQILTVWNTHENLISHEPKNGQMDMEQAMTAGKAWISRLVKHGLLAPGLTENSFSHVSAMLYTPEGSSDLPDYLLSRWHVTYSNEDYQICLLIHAASGQVWQAELLAAEGIQLVQSTGETLLETAFPFIIGKDSKKIITETDKYKICRSAPEGRVYAAIDEGQLAISRTGKGSFTSVTLTGITLALHSFAA